MTGELFFNLITIIPCNSPECYGCKWRRGKKKGYCSNPKHEKMNGIESDAISAGEIKCSLREAGE